MKIHCFYFQIFINKARVFSTLETKLTLTSQARECNAKNLVAT